MADSDQTAPVDDTYLEVVSFENRIFQRYAIENAVYFSPVDDTEIELLQLLDNVFSLMFENRLIFPPIAYPRRVLDCGFGSASWALQVAERHPECEVIGIDTYPYPYLLSADLPPNLELQIDDLNSPSTFVSNHFDFVHSRLMCGGIHKNRWQAYLDDTFRVLAPGGWCQMVEIYFNAQSDNGTLTDNHALRMWSQNYLGSVAAYKDPRAPLRLDNLMRQAGFTEVETRLVSLPLCGWGTNDRDRAVGTSMRQIVYPLLNSLAIYPFTQFLRMTSAQVQVLVAQARAEADSPNFKAYFPVYVAIGRKPTGGEGGKVGGGSSRGSPSSRRAGDIRRRTRR